jgi:ADP-ribosylglycohydrolase
MSKKFRDFLLSLNDPNYDSTHKFNWDYLVNKYRDRARKKITEKIKKRTGIKNARELAELSERIYDRTESLMKEKYVLKNPIDPHNWEALMYHFEQPDFSDFGDWYAMVKCIPLYQSLGDTIGYHNGEWEFNRKNPAAGPDYANEMIGEFIHLGGINGLSIVNWIASDDTVLYGATYDVLMHKISSIQDYGEYLKERYLEVWPEMANRAPGQTTARSIRFLENYKWDTLPYDSQAIGNGSCMRSGCVGIFYPGRPNRKKLIALAVETSRLTHNSAIAILGSITTAIFTAYAIEKVPIAHWPHKLLKLLKSNKIDKYMESSRPAEYKFYVRDKGLYTSQWETYVSFRFDGLVPRLNLPMMKNPVLRIKYLSEKFSKCNKNNPGSCADDACIISYDSLLQSGDNLEKILVYSILHNGDSDTVGSIAFSWFGGYFFSAENYNLAQSRFEQLEYKDAIDTSNLYGLIKFFKVYYHDLYLHFARKLIRKIPAIS